MTRLGVVVAVEAEAAAILDDGRFAWRPLAEHEFASEVFPIRLAVSGVGKAFAAWASAQLAPSCDLMLSLGTSGGLGSEEIGALALAKEFVEHDMDATGLGLERGVTPFAGMAGPVISRLSPASESLAVEAFAAAGFGPRGLNGPRSPWVRSAAGDRFVGDPADAADLARWTGASLCDMESASIAKLCACRAGLDFFALRSVSDNADHRARLSWSAQVEISSVDFDAYLLELGRRLL